MIIKLAKAKKKIKDSLVKLWYFTMKPLAFVLTRISDARYKKLVVKCKSMSDEELIKRFARYLIKDMVRRNKTKTEFIVFNKRGHSGALEDEQRLILWELRNIGYRYKDEPLRRWHYHSDKARLWHWYSSDESEDRYPAYEKKLNELLKQELDRLGVKNEYVDDREIGCKTQGDKYDFYGQYLDRIGYEKTLMIYL